MSNASDWFCSLADRLADLHDEIATVARRQERAALYPQESSEGILAPIGVWEVEMRDAVNGLMMQLHAAIQIARRCGESHG